MEHEEFKKLLKQFHKRSDRHILVVETDMPFSDIQKVVHLSNLIRKAGNELVALMRKNYQQLLRIKKYRKLLKLYGKTKDKKKRKDLDREIIAEVNKHMHAIRDNWVEVMKANHVYVKDA